MNGDTTGKTSKAEPGTNWQRLRDMSDEEVHAAVVADPEIKPTDEEFWKKARVIRPQSQKLVTSDFDARFKRAVVRISYEVYWLYTYQIAIDRLRGVDAVGMDFFRVSLTALLDAQLIRLVRILENKQNVASFFYLWRSNRQVVDAAMKRTGLELNVLEAVAEKLRNIRNKTFVHIDKDGVFDPKKFYKDAGLRADEVANICSQLRATMRDLYHLTHEKEFECDEYNGEDILVLANLRDKMESGKILA